MTDTSRQDTPQRSGALPTADSPATGTSSRSRRPAWSAGTSVASTVRVQSEPGLVGSLVGRVRVVVALVKRTVTPVGWATILLMVCSWVVGWWFGWDELMLISAVAFVCVGVAVGFVLGSTKLDVAVELSPNRVVVGRRAAGSLVVSNPTTRRMLPSRMELMVGSGAAEFAIPSLAPGAEHEELFVLPTQRRGVIPVGPAVTVKGDPLGLLRRAIPWTKPVPLYVHPRTTHLGHLGAGFMRDLEGQSTPDLSPADIAFHTLREYQHGDDRRFIHWMTSARVGELMVRQFTDTRRAHLAVVLDADVSSYSDGRADLSEQFELAVSVAGSLGVRALADEQDVTIVSGSRTLPCHNPPSMLDGLADVRLQRKQQLVHQVERLIRSSSGVSLAVILTGANSTVADLRAATMRFSIDVRTLAIRVDPHQPTGLQPVGSTIVMTVGSLDELAQLMWVVTQ